MTGIPISVILPVYNADAYLEAAVNSILAQTFRDFELLLIDDGSADNSAAILSSFNDKRIRILTNEKNEGLIFTLNRGIDAAEGKYIARMDADDISFPDRFEKQFAFMEKNPSIGVTGGFMTELGEKRIYRHNYLDDERIRSAFLFTNPVVHPSAMIRRESLGDTRYSKDYPHGEDYALWISLLPKTGFSVLPQPLIAHRSHSGQVSVKFYEEQKSSVSKAQQLLFHYLGLNPDEQEKELHLSLFLERYRKEEAYLTAIENWLLKLVVANEKTNFSNRAAFNRLIGERWFRVNQELAANGCSSFSRYKKSELAGLYSAPVFSSARLFARSVLNKSKKEK
jgi:glycosyltransferase involved in cell wall biosynthesis